MKKLIFMFLLLALISCKTDKPSNEFKIVKGLEYWNFEQNKSDPYHQGELSLCVAVVFNQNRLYQSHDRISSKLDSIARVRLSEAEIVKNSLEKLKKEE
jgi:hypothetical protein